MENMSCLFLPISKHTKYICNQIVIMDKKPLIKRNAYKYAQCLCSDSIKGYTIRAISSRPTVCIKEMKQFNIC